MAYSRNAMTSNAMSLKLGSMSGSRPQLSGYRSGRGLSQRPCIRVSRLGRHSLVQFLTRAEGKTSGIDPPDIRKLAEMARLEVTDEEISDWTPKLEKITDWFGALSDANVADIEPALRGSDASEGTTRADIVFRHFAERNSILPSEYRKGEFIAVPKVLNEGDQ